MLRQPRYLYSLIKVAVIMGIIGGITGSLFGVGNRRWFQIGMGAATAAALAQFSNGTHALRSQTYSSDTRTSADVARMI